MRLFKSVKKIDDSRSPHGERGLKFLILVSRNRNRKSLPPRGAWIEMKEVNNNAES